MLSKSQFRKNLIFPSLNLNDFVDTVSRSIIYSNHDLYVHLNNYPTTLDANTTVA